MARKTKKKHHKVGARKHKKRRMGAIQTIGAPRRRHLKKHHHAKRRRIGASDVGKSTLGEFVLTTLGVGAGLFTAEIGGRVLVGAMGNTQGAMLGSSAMKMVAGGLTFYAGKKFVGNNSFVKGAGIGFAGSSINDAFRALQRAGVINGPGDMNKVMNLRDRGNVRMLPPAQRILSAPIRTVGTPGAEDSFYTDQVLHG